MKKYLRKYWYYYLLFLMVAVGTLVWALIDKDNAISVVGIGVTLFLGIIALYQNAKYKNLSDETESKFLQIQEDIKNISNQIYILADLKEIPMINVRSHGGVFKDNRAKKELKGKLICNEPIVLQFDSITFIKYEDWHFYTECFIENTGRNIINKVKLNKIKYEMFYRDERNQPVIAEVEYNVDNEQDVSINNGQSICFQVLSPFNEKCAYQRIVRTFFFELETDIRNRYNYVVKNELKRSNPDYIFSNFVCSNSTIAETPYKIQGGNNGDN